ncbi:DUF4097 family beta strand repeat-containing protein [Streptomyces sp. NPDC093509]|uniref:DUF4097 family beta strand repeat-containing protein n=1 Tax=Streptomyces sp. NPDC093509 TaxID=3154982 RepID=UPI00344FA296
MTTRKLTAETAGPIAIAATIQAHAGAITVMVDPDCKYATLTLHTPAEDGPAAEAIREASLHQTASTLYASIQGKGGSNTTVVNGPHGTTVVQSSTGVVFGTMTGVVISGGDITIDGVRMGPGSTHLVSPVEITAVVPAGSSLVGITQSAHITVTGPMVQATATTQSGDVRIEQADVIKAKTQSGDIHLGKTDVTESTTMSGDITIADFAGSAQLKTMSGDIRVHATAGGDLAARSMSGDINVTATAEAIADNLNVQPSTMSGRIHIPTNRPYGSAPRRRR